MIAHLLHQVRRSFYISEEQGDRSRRQFRHSWPPHLMTARGASHAGSEQRAAHSTAQSSPLALAGSASAPAQCALASATRHDVPMSASPETSTVCPCPFPSCSNTRSHDAREAVRPMSTGQTTEVSNSFVIMVTLSLHPSEFLLDVFSAHLRIPRRCLNGWRSFFGHMSEIIGHLFKCPACYT